MSFLPSLSFTGKLFFLVLCLTLVLGHPYLFSLAFPAALYPITILLTHFPVVHMQAIFSTLLPVI